MNFTKSDFRAVIFYNFKRRLWRQQCMQEMEPIFGNKVSHQTTINRWWS